MRREFQERFSRYRLQRNALVSDPEMHHGSCVTHMPWCMSGSLTRSGVENIPDIHGACATRNFTHLARDPFQWRHMSGMACQVTVTSTICSALCSGLQWKKTPKFRVTVPLWEELIDSISCVFMSMPWRHHAIRSSGITSRDASMKESPGLKSFTRIIRVMVQMDIQWMDGRYFYQKHEEWPSHIEECRSRTIFAQYIGVI